MQTYFVSWKLFIKNIKNGTDLWIKSIKQSEQYSYVDFNNVEWYIMLQDY